MGCKLSQGINIFDRGFLGIVEEIEKKFIEREFSISSLFVDTKAEFLSSLVMGWSPTKVITNVKYKLTEYDMNVEVKNSNSYILRENVEYIILFIDMRNKLAKKIGMDEVKGCIGKDKDWTIERSWNAFHLSGI